MAQRFATESESDARAGRRRRVWIGIKGYPERMSLGNPDPEPRETPGLEPGGGVSPGDTPPGESSTSGAGPRQETSKGWAMGPLIAILVVAALVAGFFLAYALLL